MVHSNRTKILQNVFLLMFRDIKIICFLTTLYNLRPLFNRYVCYFLIAILQIKQAFITHPMNARSCCGEVHPGTLARYVGIGEAKIKGAVLKLGGCNSRKIYFPFINSSGKPERCQKNGSHVKVETLKKFPLFQSFWRSGLEKPPRSLGHQMNEFEEEL